MPRAKDLKDDEILRFQRFAVTESAAATYTQQSFDTQLSIHIGLIWLIHFIEVFVYMSMIDDPLQDAAENLSVQVTRESKAGMANFHDPDVIMRIYLEKDRTATIGTDAGPVIIPSVAPIVYTYAPPIAYAAQNIHVSILGSAASAKYVQGRIGYTLRKVSDKFFFRVAQALIS